MWLFPLDDFDYDNWYPWYSSNQTDNIGWFTNEKILSCYSETVLQKSEGRIVSLFLFLVICCNGITIVCFAGALYVTRTNHDHPLCTIGDAIPSFIQNPDPCTRGRCLMERNRYKRGPKSKEWIPRPASVGHDWTRGRCRWRKALTLEQWMSYTLWWPETIRTSRKPTALIVYHQRTAC